MPVLIKYVRMLFAVYISFAHAYENGGVPRFKGNALTLPFAFAAVFFVKFLAEIKHVIA